MTNLTKAPWPEMRGAIDEMDAHLRREMAAERAARCASFERVRARETGDWKWKIALALIIVILGAAFIAVAAAKRRAKAHQTEVRP